LKRRFFWCAEGGRGGGRGGRKREERESEGERGKEERKFEGGVSFLSVSFPLISERKKGKDFDLTNLVIAP